MPRSTQAKHIDDRRVEAPPAVPLVSGRLLAEITNALPGKPVASDARRSTYDTVMGRGRAWR